MTLTTQTTPARTDLPTAGDWTADPSHTSIEASARHLTISKVRGRFSRFEVRASIGEDLTESSVEVTIDAASIDTNEPKRDAHLISPDFLDVENHPTLDFRSTGIRHVEGQRFEIDGDLTIRGVSRPVTLDTEFLGLVTDPWGNSRAAFHATTDLVRADFGMTWNQALEGGGLLVGKTLKVELNVALVRG